MTHPPAHLRHGWRGWWHTLTQPRPSAPPDDSKLKFWSEKFPLGLAALAQSFVVFRWYLGPDVPAEVAVWLAGLNIAVAVAAGLALDLVVISTVMAKRHGRRSGWGLATALAAAVFSAAVALEVYGKGDPNPWLHIAYPAVVFLFAQHLASPREPLVPERDLVQARAMAAQAADEAAQLRQERADLAREVARTPDLLAQRDTEAAQLAEDLTQARAEVARLRSVVAQPAPAVAQPRLSDDAATIEISGTRLSLRQAEEALGISASTIRRKMADWSKKA
jgi:hypothetical protein